MPEQRPTPPKPRPLSEVDDERSLNQLIASCYEKLSARASRQVDGSWLAAFRVSFGLAMSISMLRFLAYGWVERFFVEPRMHFKYWGFAWVEPLSAAGMTLLFQALAVLAFFSAVGLCFRLSATLFAIGLCYFQLIDVSTYLNHYYLAALLAWLLALSPAGQVASIDSWLRRVAPPRFGSFSRRLKQRPFPPAARVGVAVFWLYLLRFQVGVVYGFAGLAKLNSDWLIHAQPLRIWLGAKTHLPLLGPLFTLEGVPLLMSWAGFLFDSTIVLWLSWRRTRPFAYALVVLFHILTRVLFPIGMFPVIMTVSALVFFSPAWPRTLLGKTLGAFPRSSRWWARLSPTAATSSAPSGTLSTVPAPQSAASPRVSVAALAFAALYCSVQLALPLRYLAYGGNVMWHEQGMRFSWRVMLRAKGGSVTFRVRDQSTGREARVAPREYLTDLQEAEMVSQPDLVLQLAQVIQRDYQARGWRDVQVRAESLVTLNGRRSTALIQPEVDLTEQVDGLGRYHWITQAPEEAPHHTRPVL